MNEKILKVLEFDKIILKLEKLCQSYLGKETAKNLKPYINRNEIEPALKETDDGVKFIMKRGNPPFLGIHNISDSLKRLEMEASLSPLELLRVGDILKSGRFLKKFSNSTAKDDGENIVKDLISTIETNRILEDNIFNAIISEDEISDMASPALKTIRRQINNLQSSLREKLNQTIKSAKYQKAIQDPIVTIRNERYVIPVKQEYRGEIKGLIHDSSASGATIYIEPTFAVDANNNIKHAKLNEQIEIERILKELSQEVFEFMVEIKSNISMITKLDFIFAKAKLSIEFNCITPELNEEKKILIKKGRHPLLNKVDVVPTDFNIGFDFTTLVITGPNTGGKTVTLKTVGLFTMMTQAGLNIPANDGTQMSIFSNIFADIGDEQSIEQSLSTFSSHMKNIINILNNIDDNSLVLFDELGAGTDPSEGAALAMSILSYLNERNIITLGTTHYSELKAYAVLTEGIENASCEFNIESLMPTYKLLIGIPGKSNAFAISEKLGLPKNFVDGAKKLLSTDEIKFEDMLLMIERNLAKSEKYKLESLLLKKEVEKKQKEIDNQKSTFDQEKEKIIKEAKLKSKQIMEQANNEAEELLREIRKIKEDKELINKQKFAEEIRSRIKTKIRKIEKTIVVDNEQQIVSNISAKDIKLGDTVFINRINMNGTVLTLPDKDNNLSIQAGIIKICENLNSIRLVKEKNIYEEPKIQKRTKPIDTSKATSLTREIDVRGFILDDAIEAVDKYLDDGALFSFNEVTIIHGKGTGVLRSGIHRYLKSNNRIRTYRIGIYGEGDSGVTIVELK